MNKKTNSDDKLKPLLPVLRTKKRFIRIKIESSKKFSFKEISDNLTEELCGLLGSLYLGKSGFWLLPDTFDFKNQEVICRISLSSKNKILGAFSIISHFDSISTAIRVDKISGTLKGVKK